MKMCSTKEFLITYSDSLSQQLTTYVATIVLFTLTP